MKEIKLKNNQAALVLEASEEGEINVEIAFPNEQSGAGDLATQICQIIGKKLTQDPEFQEELLDALEQAGE